VAGQRKAKQHTFHTTVRSSHEYGGSKTINGFQVSVPGKKKIRHSQSEKFNNNWRFL